MDDNIRGDTVKIGRVIVADGRAGGVVCEEMLVAVESEEGDKVDGKNQKEGLIVGFYKRFNFLHIVLNVAQIRRVFKMGLRWGCGFGAVCCGLFAGVLAVSLRLSSFMV